MNMPRRRAKALVDVRGHVPCFELLEGRRLMAANLLIDVVAGAASASVVFCGYCQDKVVFTSRVQQSATETKVWLTDGTPDGTRQVGAIPGHGYVSNGVTNGATMYFSIGSAGYG